MKHFHWKLIGIFAVGGVIGYFIGVNNAPAPAAPAAAAAPATTAAH